MTYIGKQNCVVCGKMMVVRTTQKKYCLECYRLRDNKRSKLFYRNPKNKIKHKIIMKQWYERNKEKQKEYSKIWRKQNKKVVNARNMASRHIPLKDNCVICNSDNHLERHHWDYNKPLLINTLCKECHTIQHIKNFGGFTL